MALNDVKVTVTDGALGIIPENTDGIVAVLGACAAGTANTIYPFNDTAGLEATLNHGPAVEAAAYSLSVAGGPIYVVPVNQSVSGVASTVAVTRVGSSTGTLATTGSTPNDNYSVQVIITRDGTLGTAAFKYSLDDGPTFSPEISMPSSGTYVISDAGITLVFTPSSGPVFFQTGDLFTFTTTAPGYSTTDLANAFTALLADASKEWDHALVVGAPAPATSTVSQTGSGPAITITGTPAGYYDLLIHITLGGIVGTATFKWSLDGGASYTTGVVTASTVILGTTGLTAHFAAGTYVLDEVYSFNTYGPITALAAAVSTQMATAQTAYRFTYAILEAPDTTDAILVTAMANFADKRVTMCAGYEDLSSPISGRTYKRGAAWVESARLAAIPISEHPGRVASGPVLGVSNLYRDENATPALDAARFTTLRRIIGRQGFYITNGKTMAPAGSDFQEVQYLRVMNKACALTRNALLQFLNSSLRINADGTINENDARGIEDYVTAALRAGITQTGDASAVLVQVNRTDNILSTKTLRVKTRVTPLGYAEFIEEEIGFYNPALVPAAA
jgi:hypothetical protein